MNQNAVRGETIDEAIQRTERHILDVSTGRVRLNLTPEELDEYLDEEYRRLCELQAARG